MKLKPLIVSINTKKPDRAHLCLHMAKLIIQGTASTDVPASSIKYYMHKNSGGKKLYLPGT